ncbi:sigma-fimbriae chaperone protein [alpha proteobacterium U9-1i]|nr:sigma-fimbriae chaperone protein [alpha proteobacterium U9-1i]
MPLAMPLIPPASAETNGVQVTPVIIQVAPERRLASVRVHNRRDTEMMFEVNVFAWSQDDGADVLSETTDVVVAPSVFAVRPGQEQIVRLAIMAAAREAGREAAYRLILRQLPAAEAGAGLRVQLQMSLPVFAPPRGATTALEARRSRDGAVVLSNIGTSVVRIADVQYGADASLPDMPRYLLAGEEVTRPAPNGVGALRVSYTTLNQPALSTDTLVLDAPLALVGVR